MQGQAQITESGKIKVYFQNGNNWDAVKLYVKGNDSGNTEIAPWPGTDITSNTIEIDGATYNYYIVDMSQLNEATSITVNFNNGTNQQSYDWGNISYDVFFTIASTAKETGEWNKYELTREEKYYLYDTSDKISTKLDLVSDKRYRANIDMTSASANHTFVVASNAQFNWGTEINGDYWNNVWRPWDEYKSELGFKNISLDQNNCFYGGGQNSWCFSKGIEYEFTIDLTADGSNYKFGISSFISRKITDGYATFSSDYAVAIPEGVTAYYAPSAEVGKVNMKKFNNGIPANEGAFLEVTTDGTYKFTPATTTDAITTNLLKKGTSSGLTASTEGTYHYVFAMQNDKLCFYNVAQDIDADLTGKAYLETTTSIKPTNGAPILANFGGEDGTTGINSLTPALSEGKGVYTLDGRKLNVMPSAKGIYIVNGKKVIVK